MRKTLCLLLLVGGVCLSIHPAWSHDRFNQHFVGTNLYETHTDLGPMFNEPQHLSPFFYTLSSAHSVRMVAYSPPAGTSGTAYLYYEGLLVDSIDYTLYADPEDQRALYPGGVVELERGWGRTGNATTTSPGGTDADPHTINVY